MSFICHKISILLQISLTNYLSYLFEKWHNQQNYCQCSGVFDRSYGKDIEIHKFCTKMDSIRTASHSNPKIKKLNIILQPSLVKMVMANLMAKY